MELPTALTAHPPAFQSASDVNPNVHTQNSTDLSNNTAINGHVEQKSYPTAGEATQHEADVCVSARQSTALNREKMSNGATVGVWPSEHAPLPSPTHSMPPINGTVNSTAVVHQNTPFMIPGAGMTSKELQADTEMLRKELAVAEQKVKQLQDTVELLASQLREQRSSFHPAGMSVSAASGRLHTDSASREEGETSETSRPTLVQNASELLTSPGTVLNNSGSDGRKGPHTHSNGHSSSNTRKPEFEWDKGIEWAKIPVPAALPYQHTGNAEHAAPKLQNDTYDATPDAGDSSPPSSNGADNTSTSTSLLPASSGSEFTASEAEDLKQDNEGSTGRSQKVPSGNESHNSDSSGALTTLAKQANASQRTSPQAANTASSVILEEVFTLDGRRLVLDKDTGSLYAKGVKLQPHEVQLLVEVNLLPSRVVPFLHLSGNASTNSTSMTSPTDAFANKKPIDPSHYAARAMWANAFPHAYPPGIAPGIPAVPPSYMAPIAPEAVTTAPTSTAQTSSALDALITAVVTSEADGAESGTDAKAASSRPRRQTRGTAGLHTERNSNDDESSSGYKRKRGAWEESQTATEGANAIPSTISFDDGSNRVIDCDEIPTTAPPANPLKGKLEEWEREKVDEFIEAVQTRRMLVSKGDLARAMREYVNVRRHQDFWEKLVSRRRLNETLTHLLGPARSRKRNAGDVKTSSIVDSLPGASTKLMANAPILLPGRSGYGVIAPYLQYPMPGLPFPAVFRSEGGAESAFSPYLDAHHAAAAPQASVTEFMERALPSAAGPAYFNHLKNAVFASQANYIPLQSTTVSTATNSMPMQSAPSSITARLGLVGHVGGGNSKNV